MYTREGCSADERVRKEEIAMGVDVAPGETRKPIVIEGLAGLRERVGTELGVSDWTEVVQENINTFAKLTGDEQYIHVDPERAAQGPFGTTVQHGFFTLGMATGLLWSVCTVEGFKVILNYGLNKVRFPSPLKTGARFRMRVELAEVKELDGGAEAIYRLTYEVADEPKPCCVADLVFRYYS
jgi:acyl dehydratase